tara:strand:+ start:3791 stop:4102 length:312 start_codon:yes stop_codon:yes gene_type:complete
MSEQQLYREVESLKNIVKRYSKIIGEQEDIIKDLRVRMFKLSQTWKPSEPSYDREGMIAKLDHAQGLLSDVYHEACEAGLTEIESQMSCADSCICEALSELDR